MPEGPILITLRINLMRPLAYNPSFALNAICPYFTMFPLEYPLRVLKKHRALKPVVIDPFCGRGTTLFAARTLELESWGIDSSPVAVAIARAKLSNAKAEDALCLAQLLILSAQSTQVPQDTFFKSAYHSKTLRQICSLREGLLKLADDDISIMLRAAVLGCLHGPLLKSGAASYFSNQMPRTFAPKPDYAIKYWKKKNLIAPEVDVLSVLERKLKLIAATRELANTSHANVIHGDATVAQNLPLARNYSLVVTSPPYYGMKTYVQDQWLRNWFLGGPTKVDYSAGVQLEHTGQDVFASSLGKVWANMADTKADSLHMYIRFGVIPSAKVDAKTLLFESLEASGANFKVISARNAASAHSGKRQAEQMRTYSGACDEYDFHVVKH